MIINVRKVQDSVTPSITGILRAISRQGIRRLLVATGQEFLRQTRASFGGNNTKYLAEKWPPLSPAYAKRVGRTKATLKVSGNLYNSIKLNSPRSNFIEVYTTNKYAAAHMLGYPPRNLPRRNYFPIQFYTPTYSRLTWNSERDLVVEISKRMTILSGGHLPRLSSAIIRSLPTYGNPFTAPQSTDT